MVKPLTTVALAMAAYSEGYERNSSFMKLASSMYSGSKYIMNPELRAEQVNSRLHRDQIRQQNDSDSSPHQATRISITKQDRQSPINIARLYRPQPSSLFHLGLGVPSWPVLPLVLLSSSSQEQRKGFLNIPDWEGVYPICSSDTRLTKEWQTPVKTFPLIVLPEWSVLTTGFRHLSWVVAYLKSEMFQSVQPVVHDSVGKKVQCYFTIVCWEHESL